MGHKNEVRDVQYVCMRACIYIKFVDFFVFFEKKQQQHKLLNNFKKCQKEPINIVFIYLFSHSFQLNATPIVYMHVTGSSGAGIGQILNK